MNQANFYRPPAQLNAAPFTIPNQQQQQPPRGMYQNRMYNPNAIMSQQPPPQQTQQQVPPQAQQSQQQPTQPQTQTATRILPQPQPQAQQSQQAPQQQQYHSNVNQHHPQQVQSNQQQSQPNQQAQPSQPQAISTQTSLLQQNPGGQQPNQAQPAYGTPIQNGGFNPAEMNAQPQFIFNTQGRPMNLVMQSGYPHQNIIPVQLQPGATYPFEPYYGQIPPNYNYVYQNQPSQYYPHIQSLPTNIAGIQSQQNTNNNVPPQPTNLQIQNQNRNQPPIDPHLSQQVQPGQHQNPNLAFANQTQTQPQQQPPAPIPLNPNVVPQYGYGYASIPPQPTQPLPQPTLAKREKKPLLIVDPNTKQPIPHLQQQNQDTTKATPQPSTATTTTTTTTNIPKSNSTSSDNNNNVNPSSSSTPVNQPTTTTAKPATTTSSNLTTTTTATSKDTINKDKKPQDLQTQLLINMKTKEETTAPSSTTNTTTSNSNTTTTGAAQISDKNKSTATVNVSNQKTEPVKPQSEAKPAEQPKTTATNIIPAPTPIAQSTQPPQPLSYSKITQVIPTSQPKPTSIPNAAQQAQVNKPQQVESKTTAQKPSSDVKPKQTETAAPVKPIAVAEAKKSSTSESNKVETDTKTQAKQPEQVQTQPQPQVKPETQPTSEPKQTAQETESKVSSNEKVDTKMPVVTDNKTNDNNNNLNKLSADETKTPSDAGFWTPENKDGKKRYDRDFLMSFKDKKLSKILPECLKNNPDFQLLEQSSQKPGGLMPGSSYDRSKSDYNYGGGKSGSMKKNPKNSMNMGKNKDSMERQPPAVINLPEKIVLKTVENPYVIKKLTNVELNEQDELLREVRNILNKLTPQNLQKLTSDLINLGINNEDRLKGAIDIIFEKSIDEQVFSQTYAQLCKVLNIIKVPSNADSTKFVLFRTMLLTRCQKEFDTDFYQEINYDKLMQEVESCTDEQKKKELKEIADDKLVKAKRRSLGNIRFIGELFKLSMLTEGIMNDCIERLLKQENDEENIECLCRLLTTIGKEVDKPNNAAKMKIYFEKLDRIVKKKDTVSARIRFMILDVIDLRKNNWVPRHSTQDNAPRKIEEIRKEHEEKMRKEQELLEKQQQEKREKMQSQGGQKGGQKYQQSLKSTSMDSESFRSKAHNGSMATKIKDVKQITNTKISNDLLLGPGGSSGGFMWNKPKTVPQDLTQSSMTPSSSISSNISSASTNQASSAGKSDDYERRSMSSAQSGPFSKTGKQNLSETTARLSMDSNKGVSFKDKQVINVKKMDNQPRSEASSQASSRETSVSRPSRDNSGSRNSDTASNCTDASISAKRIQYTEDEIERKAINTIEELVQNKDISEALKDLEEIRPVDNSQYALYYEQLIHKVLERNEHARTTVGQLFVRATIEKKLEIKNLSDAFRNVLEIAEDMAIDVPKIATYLSQIIAPMFNKDLSVEFLADACEPIMKTQICADLISECLHNASNRLGHSTVNEIFKASNLKIHQFLGGVPNPTEFIKQNNIQWVIGNRERTQSASVSADSYEKLLYQIMENINENNENIFEKIENEFSEQDCSSKAFVRALVIALCRSCLTESKIDAELFKKRSPIITKYAKNEDFELEALFAVQALDHRMKHLPGFIRVIFDMLYDEDIINETVFWRWQSDVREEGHAISALSLKAFFEWLSEADGVNDENS